MPRLATGLDSVRMTGDVYLESVAQKSDIAILIVGPTGVGKTTFIRSILHAADPKVNAADEPQSVTDRMVHYPISIPGRPDGRVILVDSPSFNRGAVRDAFETLRQISSWLASLHDAGHRVGGIVYMYPIFPGKLTRNDATTFQVFRKLCGSHHFLRILGVTTKWDSCPEGIGEGREREIWGEFWKGMGHRDPIKVHRLRNTIESALCLFQSIVQRCELAAAVDPPPLAIQREIVVKRKAFMETNAAKFLTSVLANKENDFRKNASPISLIFRQATVSISAVTEGGLNVYNRPQHCRSCHCFRNPESAGQPRRNSLPEPPPDSPQSVASSYCTVPSPTQDMLAPDPRLSVASSYYTALLGSPTSPNGQDLEDSDSFVMVDGDEDSRSFSSSSSTLRSHGPPSGSSSNSTLPVDGSSFASQESIHEFERQGHGNFQNFMPNASHFSARDFIFNNLQVQSDATVNINNITFQSIFQCPYGHPWSSPPRRSTF